MGAAIGTPKPFGPDVIERMQTSLWRRQILLKAWDHYVAKGRREGVL